MDRYPNVFADHRMAKVEDGNNTAEHMLMNGGTFRDQTLPTLFADVPHNFYGPCKVCDSDATGLHYGVATCEGCKGFFKRSLESATGCQQYTCATGLNNCIIRPQTRNACRACRLRKCKEVGMEWKAHRKRIRMKSLINEAKLDDELQASASANSTPILRANNQPQQFFANGARNIHKVDSLYRSVQTPVKAVEVVHVTDLNTDDDFEFDQRNGLDGNFGQLFTTVDELLQTRPRHALIQRNFGADAVNLAVAVEQRLNHSTLSYPLTPQIQLDNVSALKEKAASSSPSANNHVGSQFRRLLPPKKAYTWSNAKYSLQQPEELPSTLSPSTLLTTALSVKPDSSPSPNASLYNMRSSSTKSVNARESEVEADQFLVDHLSHLMQHSLTLCPAIKSAANDTGENSVSCSSSKSTKDSKTNRNMLIHRFDMVGLLQDYLILQVLKRTANSVDYPAQRFNSKRNHEHDFQAISAMCGVNPPASADSHCEAEQECLMLRKRARSSDGVADGDVNDSVREEIRRCITNVMIAHADKAGRVSGKDVTTSVRDEKDMAEHQVQRILTEFAGQQQLRHSSNTPKEQFFSSVNMRMGDILRPNTTIITTSVQLMHKGFIDCFLESLVGGRSLQRLLREQPVYEPQTTIDGFMSAFSVHMAQMAVLAVRFGNNFVPGFWRFGTDIKHFCVQTNMTLTFYVIFAELIEQNNSYVVLNDMNAEINNGPTTTDLADRLHTSYYWMRFVMPETLMKFNKELAAFILSMHLPDRVRIILAAAAWCYAPDYSHVPERFRSLIMASMTRLNDRKLFVYQRELRGMHDHLLRIVMAAINFCYSYDEQEARTLRNKVLFLFRVINMRMALYTCYFIRNIPLRFYDDGSFDWQHLQTFCDRICTPEMTHWMNGIWTLVNTGVIDFSDPRFDVEQVAKQIELTLADMGGGSVASWTM